MKLSGNPRIAFQQGLAEGQKRSNEAGFSASNLLLLLAYYNVIDDFVKTHKTQAGLVNALEKEMNRLFAEEFMHDVDKIEQAYSKIEDIRKHFRMEGEVK